MTGFFLKNRSSKDKYINNLSEFFSGYQEDLFISNNSDLFIGLEMTERKIISEDGNDLIFLSGDIFSKYNHNSSNDLFKHLFFLLRKDDKTYEKISNTFWGKYSFVFLSKNKENIFLFRDPTGLNSVFYFSNESIFCFSTSLVKLYRLLKTFLRLRIVLDEQYLFSFVYWGNHTTTRTPFKEVAELTQGSFLKVNDEHTETGYFWNPVNYVLKTKKNLYRRFKTIMGLTINRVLDNKSVCLDLSGGIDSSILAYLVKSNGNKLIPVNISYQLTGTANELDFANSVAKSLDLTMEVIDGSESTLFSKSFLEWPIYDKPSVQIIESCFTKTYSEIKKRHGIDVFINGYGGDQVFGGPATDYSYLIDYLFSFGFKTFIRQLIGVSFYRGEPMLKILFSLLKRYFNSKFNYYFDNNFKPQIEWIDKKLASVFTANVFIPFFVKDLERLSPFKAVRILDIFDSSAFVDRGIRGVENQIIHPFLYQPIVEMGLSMSINNLISFDKDRILFRNLFKGKISDKILNRFNKSEHSGAYQLMIKDNIEGIKTVLRDGFFVNRGFVDYTLLERDLDRVSLSFSNNLWPILNLICLEIWLKQIKNINT